MMTITETAACGRRFLVILSALCSLTSSLCFASQYAELVTDRPDQTESSKVVPYKSVQIETGWVHSKNDDDDLETDVFPDTLLRYGLTHSLELRLRYGGYNWDDAVGSEVGATNSEGSGDVAVGLKLQLRKEKGWLPEAALLSRVVLPTGEAPFSNERFGPGYELAFSHTLSDRLSFGYNLGQNWPTEEDTRGDRDTRHEFIYAAVLGIGLTDRLGGFVEFFGDIPTGSNGGPANAFDGGFTYLMAKNLQLDVSSGVGLSDAADDWFVSAGLSVRFP